MQIINRSKLLLQRLKVIFGNRPLLIIGVVFAIMVAIIVSMPASTGWLEFYLYDLKHLLAARFRAADPSLVIVGIDMKTLASREKRWPWPRQDVAETLRCLSRLEPRGVIIDILFQNSDSERADAKLEQAIEDLGNVILISLLEEKTSPQGLSLVRFTSLPRFSEKALAEGFAQGLIDPDARLRRFKITDERLGAQSAALTAFHSYYKADTAHNAKLPVEAPIVFAKKDGGIPVISLRDIIEHEEQFKEFCRDKILVLGVNAPAVHDFHNTPIGVVSGAEILAASLDTLISNRIGRIVFNDWRYRFAMIIAGIMLGWLAIMSSIPLIFTPIIFVVTLTGLMVISEILLLHFPLAVMMVGWLASSLICYTATYFDNLFSLRAMQNEADNARLVQEQLLPGNELVFKDYRVFGVSRPANELGGDYFDYFVVKDRYLLAIIGDVTGHGMPSALAMAIAKAAVLLGLENDLKPEKLVESINAVLFNALRRKLMMTAAILWIDTETHEFEYRNCGHPYPYIFKENNSVEHLASGGLFLGTKATYRSTPPHLGNLKPGERILFYTDGLIESIPATREQDGFNLFRDYLLLRPKLPVIEACSDILEHHPHFLSGKDQPDDFTVLMVERSALN